MALATSEHVRWRKAWEHLHAAPPPDLLRQLETRYGEPHRAYHTLEHVRACLAHFDAVRALLRQPARVELAIWFHDAIYDPRAADNEERSAQWAYEALRAAGAGEEAAQQVAALIRLTQHGAEPGDGRPDGNDASLLLDIDLAILGADPAAFDAYEAQIRREYSWVPWPEFCRKRAAVLRTFTQRPAIYRTDYFRRRFEESARQNLRRSLEKLKSQIAATDRTAP